MKMLEAEGGGAPGNDHRTRAVKPRRIYLRPVHRDPVGVYFFTIRQTAANPRGGENMFEKKYTDQQEGEIDYEARNAEIVERYIEGGGKLTMKQLAEEYGVCAQRISQIIDKSGVLDILEKRAQKRVRLATIKMQYASADAAEKLVNLALKERGEEGVYADNQLLQQLLDRAGARVVKKEDNTFTVAVDFGEAAGMKLGVPDHSGDNESE